MLERQGEETDGAAWLLFRRSQHKYYFECKILEEGGEGNS